MRAPDLHPDELLDKARDGELSEAERAQLDEHLANCSACRFEMNARNDFELQLSSGTGEDAIDDLVTRALVGAKAEPERASTRGFRTRKRTTTFLVAAVAAMVSMAGVAAAARLTGVWRPKADVVPMVVVPSAAPSSLRTVRPRAHGVETRDSTETGDPSIGNDEPAVENVSSPNALPSANIVPAAPAEMPVPRSRAPQSEATTAHSTERAARARAPEGEPAPVVERDPLRASASALFGDANDARVRGSHAEAIEKYRDLLRRFPNAPEARLTHVTLGKLLLDRGDSASALDELDSYLKSGDGTLREDAIAARAIALSKLGRSSDESGAWNQLIQDYPQSVHVPRAKARLAELGPR